MPEACYCFLQLTTCVSSTYQAALWQLRCLQRAILAASCGTGLQLESSYPTIATGNWQKHETNVDIVPAACCPAYELLRHNPSTTQYEL